MKAYRITSFILAALCATLSLAAAQTTFQRTFGAGYAAWGYSGHQTTDGGYIIAGATRPSAPGLRDLVGGAYLVKTDLSGNILWTQTYWSTAAWYDHELAANSIQQTYDGGYIIAGTILSGTGYREMYLARTNSKGDTLWTRGFGGQSGEYFGTSGQQTSDSGFIITGACPLGVRGGYAAYLVKTNSSGDTLWTRAYAGPDTLTQGNSVRQTVDGGYIVAGSTYSNRTNSSYDIYLAKTNASGDTLWTKTYGGKYADEGYEVQETSEGGYIVAGSIFDDSDAEDVYLVKTNASGDTLWTKTYGGAGVDYASSIQETSDGGFIIAGSTASFGAGKFDVWLLKTDGTGDTLWTRTFGGPNGDQCSSVVQTSDGGYMIAGNTRSFSANGADKVYLIKTGPDGLVSVENDRKTLPEAFALLQNYPNPFNPATNIRYALPHRSYARLTVFNSLGQHVASVVDGEVEAGYHEVRFDGRGFASGVYLCRMTAGAFTQVRKLILVR